MFNGTLDAYEITPRPSTPDTSSSSLANKHIAPNSLPVSSWEMYSEELAAYRDGSRYVSLKGLLDPSSLMNRVDDIDSSVVASVDTKGLWDRIITNYWMFPVRSGFRYALWDEHPDSDTPPEATKESQQKYKKKKKIENKPTAPTLTSLISAAIRRLADPKKSHLFEVWNLQKNGKPLIDVGAFFVEKAGDPNKLRVIIDGRWTNLYFDQSFAKFSFFSLETLRQVIDNLSTGKWYALNFDLRHWFHEIPLPKRYKTLMGIPLTDRHTKRGDYYLVPRAFPMGWSFSPLIAQCITWSLVLSYKGRHPPAELDLPLGMMQQKIAEKCSSPYTWIPLNRGGGVFVLLDNILVVTPHQETANGWFRNIINNAKEFGAHLKVKNSPDSALSEEDRLRAQCWYSMEDSNSPPFEFLGISWSHASHSVTPKENEDLILPNAFIGAGNITSETGQWRGTYRHLASVIGRIMWFRRVHNLHFFDDPKDERGTQTLLKLFKIMTPPPEASWNDSMPPLSQELTAGLIKAWKFRSEIPSSPAMPLLRPSGSPTYFFATDSAKDEDIHSTVVVQYRASSISPELPCMSATSPLRVITGEFPAHMHIALGELDSIVKAVCSVSDDHALIVLATDSLNAKNWVETGKANNDDALSYLHRLFTHLRDRKQRLYLVYVPSQDNVADYATRPHPDVSPSKEFEQPQFESTRALLFRASHEANGLWMSSGGVTGGIPNVATRRERNE